MVTSRGSSSVVTSISKESLPVVLLVFSSDLFFGSMTFRLRAELVRGELPVDFECLVEGE